MVKKIKENYPVFIIFFITFLLFLTNYKKNTFLVGWDNLFPEFNFKLDFFKNLFAVWQEYRGLGLIDGMSHTANLINTIIRFFLSFFLPQNFIRWFLLISLHFLGGVGIYTLTNYLIKEKKIALISALFYLFNFFVIQQFFLPFEVFIFHFGFIPWLFYFFLRFILEGDKKNLILFSIFSILSTPQAHVPTLFLVYIIGLSIISLTLIILNKNSFKKIIILWLLLISFNSFWGLPYFYQTLTNSKNIANSKNFQMSSNDIFYRNKKYGDIGSVILMKSLTLDFKYLNFKTGNTEYMMKNWLPHIENPIFKFTYFFVFLLVIFGLIKSLKDKKNLPFAFLFLFSLTMLTTDTFPFSLITEMARKYIPLFATIFRFTFTKFSIIYAFSLSIMLAFGINYLNEFIKNNKFKKIFIFSLTFLIIYTALPVFKGHFFYENLAVQIPKEYFQLFEFFQKQNPNQRVAILPLPWYWAWVQPKWGTINSGFIWYGIPQPITDLAFTPWGKNNENFYWQIENAIFSQKPEILRQVLEKYDIAWIYLDKNIVQNTGKKIDYQTYEEIILNTGLVKSIKKFNNINIYEVNTKKLKDFVDIKTNILKIAPQYNYDNFDYAYIANKDYLIDEENFQIYYPFRSLFSGKSPKDFEFNVKEDEENLYFEAKLPKKVLNWPIKYLEKEEEFSIYQIKNDKIEKIKYTPKIAIDKKNALLTISFNKNLVKKYSSLDDVYFLNQNNDACEKNPKGISLLEKENQAFKLTSINSFNCIKVDIPNLELKKGYLFQIKTKNDNKRGFFVNFINKTTKKIDLETYLDNDGQERNYYFITNPRGDYDLGYTLYFNNKSEGKEKVINTLKEVNVYEIPYYYLKSFSFISPLLHLTTDRIQDRTFQTVDFEAKKIGYFLYQISNFQISQNQFPAKLYLSQSYHPGWKAYVVKHKTSNVKRFLNTFFPFIFGEEIKEHVLVNNWANGFILPSNTKLLTSNTDKFNIIIVFLPQYLEFLGFLMMGVGFLIVIKIKHQESHLD